jgi:hypothetical protein
MNCHLCERTAAGVCRFCGRALCPDHFKTRPFIIAAMPGKLGGLAVLAVEDALHCGTCHPQEDFIELPATGEPA